MDSLMIWPAGAGSPMLVGEVEGLESSKSDDVDLLSL
jgi:hypothetical protein